MSVQFLNYTLPQTKQCRSLSLHPSLRSSHVYPNHSGQGLRGGSPACKTGAPKTSDHLPSAAPWCYTIKSLFITRPVSHAKLVNYFSCWRLQLGLPCPPMLLELGASSALTACLLIKHLPPLTQAASNLKWHCSYVHSYFSVPQRNAYIYPCLGKPKFTPSVFR